MVMRRPMLFGMVARLLVWSHLLLEKRKRTNFSEEETLMMTNMKYIVANALRETSSAHVDANLFLYYEIMDMPGFSEESIIVAFTTRWTIGSRARALLTC